ncbi:MAG: ABC transporter ATP-binding protein [Lachnospiraceae bacterium]|jgi:ATP-binding cassette subfamily B multidrug efflux pump|nr:ABC transporter ATP-binding protein [Lachnospiraceae bacterium]
MKKILTFYLQPYYLRMAVGFLIKFTGTIMDLLLPWTLAHMIDVVIPANRRGGILLWGGFMLVCSLLAVSLNILANRMASRVASDAMFRIRNDLFEKIMYLSGSDLDRFTRPSLISRLTSDTYHVHQMLGRIQRLGVRAPILLTGGIVMTLLLDPALALVLLATLPLLTVVVVLVSRKSIPLFGQVQLRVDRFVQMLREDIAGIRVIKALSREDYERERFDRINREVVEWEKKATLTTALTSPAMNILLNLGMVGVLVVGAWRVNRGLSEVGKILAFMTYFTIILNALLSISRMFVMVSRAAASAERIAQVLDGPDERGITLVPDGPDERGITLVPDGPDERGIMNACDSQAEQAAGRTGAPASPPHIQFQQVSFSYTGKGRQLSDISFSLNHGETLGIIGPTGSGKSTLVQLLMRFYDVDQGVIRLDGRDIRSLDLQSLRRQFGVVFQNDSLFETDIYENISMGRSLTREQVMDAAAYAQAKEFVEEKGGLKEKLDIRGANLSGGQKQRILIARALAAHPAILVLDDSSSALDYHTDARLRAALGEHFRDTTCILIAQRISAIMEADHILVLEEGRMTGYGTHQELIRSCGLYQEIAKSQMG